MPISSHSSKQVWKRDGKGRKDKGDGVCDRVASERVERERVVPERVVHRQPRHQTQPSAACVTKCVCV
jgi:hypothetical protein